MFTAAWILNTHRASDCKRAGDVVNMAAAASASGAEDAASVKVRNEQELEDLLTEKYNYLVRHICPREFIPPLISKHVLTTADKEEIQKQITYIDRAGGANVVRVQSFITLSPSPLIP